MAKKIRLQSLVFNKNKFPTRRAVKDWVLKNDYKIDTRLKSPILNSNNNYRVRQRNPDWFNKKTFTEQSLGSGVKGVYGVLKGKI